MLEECKATETWCYTSGRGCRLAFERGKRTPRAHKLRGGHSSNHLAQPYLWPHPHQRSTTAHNCTTAPLTADLSRPSPPITTTNVQPQRTTAPLTTITDKDNNDLTSEQDRQQQSHQRCERVGKTESEESNNQTRKRDAYRYVQTDRSIEIHIQRTYTAETHRQGEMEGKNVKDIL
jgi:hypothetical protein